ATKRIGISPAKHAQRGRRDAKGARKKEIIFIRTWRSSRLGGTNIRIRDVLYVGKFTQAAKTFRHSSTTGSDILTMNFVLFVSFGEKFVLIAVSLCEICL